MSEMEYNKTCVENDCNHSMKRKKGVRNVEEYKCQRIKRARLQGKEYANYRGNVVKTKSTTESCRCARKCYDKIDIAQRGKLLDAIHSFSCKNEQDIYLQGLLDAVPIKHRRPRNGDKSGKRSSSFTFHVVIQERRVKVCKKAFIQLYGVSAKRVRRLQTLLLCGQTPKDMRGQQNNRKSVPVGDVQAIKDHISSFPVKISHHASKEYKYLDAQLDIKKMHTLFKEKFPDCKVKYSFYYKIFRENFNLHFGRPQIDTCGECEQLKVKIKNPNLNECAKRVAMAELAIHERRSNKFYTSMKDTKHICKNNDSVLGLTFDYMQNISLPCIPVQELFYYRQLSVFPFAIHNLKTDEASLFLYHEGQANKGPNETCSFLHKYISDNVPPCVKELHLYSDACGGQNKNNCMVRFLLSLTDTNRFDIIIHRFPIRGHSYLACDRDFALVKRVLKKTDRYYVPMEVCQLITSAGVPGKFTVNMVTSDDVLDFKNWWPSHYKKTCLSLESQSKAVPRSQKQDFAVSRFVEFQYNSRHKGTVVASEFIGGLVSHTFVLRQSSDKSLNPTIPVQKAYPAKNVPINAKKIIDLKKVLRYVPGEHRDFYDEIIQWPTKQTD
ncbi:uncharacterized protein LOC134527855 isoform X2 [Bacillus rossius redtenbacheri]|uniref:uncharacterized protein LOC134527855 isoform X2 n=1 Tax=Bacillus rossius redtenbacheri TaxID=93214 RepID=UPI002FDE7BB2